MVWLCSACFLRAHDDCDPRLWWCECACGLGGLLDPTPTQGDT